MRARCLADLRACARCTARLAHTSGLSSPSQAAHRQDELVPFPGSGAVVAGGSGGGAVETFWAHAVSAVPARTLKAQHAEARSVDRRSRFHVRQRLRDDGVLSNLYPLSFSAGSVGSEDKTEGSVYIYELYVTREFIASTTDATGLRLGASEDATGGAQRRRQQKRSASATTTAIADSRGDAIGTRTGDTTQRRVRHAQAWRAVSISLARRMAVVPPMVALRHRVYTAEPLPESLLQVPEDFWDLGWTCCELRPLGPCRYADLPATELQELVNKVVPWCVSRAAASGAAEGGSLALSREKAGKLVCTSHGIASAGLRVFRGCLVQAVFVDARNVDAPPPPPPPPHAVPAVHTPSAQAAKSRVVRSRTLGESPDGPVAASQLPVRFVVHAFIRCFVYRQRHVASYRIADDSGTFLASVWGAAANAVDDVTAAAPPLLEGQEYVASSKVRVRDFAERGIRLIELESDAVSAARTGDGAATQQPLPHTSGASDRRVRTAAPPVESSSSVSGPLPDSAHPGLLALKIDTKGTIAAESTLWEEVRQHFGTGPYDAAAQDRITRALVGTPVVVSYSLQQSIVRSLRFPGGVAAGRLAAGVSSGVLPPLSLTRRAMEPALADIMPRLDAGQPYAVLHDYRVLPLQVLHCCFDPRMRGWQDVAIAALSFMPAQRAQHLAEYRAALAPGLARWGLHLHTQPWSTRHLSVLPTPAKTHATGGGPTAERKPPAAYRHPPPVQHPSTVLVVGVVPERATADERERVVRQTQHMASYFHTKLATCVPGEKEAVQHMVEMLLVPSSIISASSGLPGEYVLRDANAAALIVTLDKHSRATRWVLAECLSRGVLPIAVTPAANSSRVKVLCGGLRRQLAVKFSTDPLRDVDLRKGVPSLGVRRVLLVGVDACHTTTLSTGSIVAILSTHERTQVLPVFWRQEARGRETQHVARHFRDLLAAAAALYDGLDEIVVFQDGDVFSELNAMKAEIQACVPRSGLTFLCLHKRTNIRFMFNGQASPHGAAEYHNAVKGLLIPALTPVTAHEESVAPSFYLQTHESNMSTTRTVQYTVHHCSPTLDLGEVQQIANIMANAFAPQATKLPMCTRLAHRLSDQAERLLDAVPQMRADCIPAPLNERLWYL